MVHVAPYANFNLAQNIFKCNNQLSAKFTSLGRARMIVSVVISRATRVLAFSLALSTLFRHPTTYLGPLLALTITA